MRYCEMPGDDILLDKPRYCPHIMTDNTCKKHSREPLMISSEGWRLCCKSCTDPTYEDSDSDNISQYELYDNSMKNSEN
jgi:hypothetical protein